MARPDRPAILRTFPFPLDRFQVDAIDALDDGANVVVAAPTGSGKTVVAEYGIEVAVRGGRRAFYTAPIKALSNQKFRELVGRLGVGRVGLLTGDTAVAGDAPVVVITPEVLRNMIYAGRPLDDLDMVVLDEVHFLQDAYRGPVWEEVIVHLPPHVQLVCLSATVSNATELADWITTVRGTTEVVVEERRPVRLDQWYMAADRTSDRVRVLPITVEGRPNPEAIRLDASAARGGGRRDDRRRDPGRRRLATPSRLEVVDELIRRDVLPAIHFIFSRAQCDEAARQCVAAGLRLLDDDERARIHEIADRRLEGFGAADLAMLGHDQFMSQLDAGVAAHHAGMVPPFKEVVEQAFQEGLLKVVFATETLAVGINMPARSVVIEKLTKFTGDHHEMLSAGQFTQLTGRAGRRGIDDLGVAVVLWGPFVRFDQVAALATSRSFHQRSAFPPPYNMVANLVRTYPADRARQLLGMSFAQFQVDRDVVRIERRLQRQRAKLDDLRARAASPFGDIEEYRLGRSAAAPDGEARSAVHDALVVLRPGTVVHASKGRHHGPVVVVATANRSSGLRLSTITPAGHLLELRPDDFAEPPSPLGSVVLPGTYSPNRRDYRLEVGRRLKAARLRDVDRRERSRSGDRRGEADHPVLADPDLADRLRVAAQGDRVAREIDELQQRLERRNGTVARDFDALLQLLADRGYVDVGAWRLTDRGEMLARVFHECDLLVVETLRLGLLDGLGPADLAAVVSVFVHERRSPDEPPPLRFPSAEVRHRWSSIEELSRRLETDERRSGLVPHRVPDPSLCSIVHAWVEGGGLAAVLDDEEVTGGDFVRTMKQLIDLLGQLAKVAPGRSTRSAAAAAADSAFRGVIADAAVVEAP
ncbi:MAG: DEAD/DEAH box helicase [Ilumatobacteraceae bacterium]